MAKNETKYEVVKLVFHSTHDRYYHPGEIAGFTPVAAKKLLLMGIIKPIKKQSASVEKEQE